MSDELKAKQVEAMYQTGGMVELKPCKDEELYIAHYYTRQGVTMRWTAPHCGEDIEKAYVDLAMINLDLIRIELRPEDLAIYNKTMFGRQRIYMNGELIKDNE